jgi:hypothetical protein
VQTYHRRIFKGTFTSSSNGKFNVIGTYIYGDSIFFGFSGIYSGTKTSALFMRAKSQDLNFDYYTCGFVVEEQRMWDTSYYPTVSTVDSTGMNLGTNNLNTFQVPVTKQGDNYPKSSWPLVFEAFSASLRTVSFFTGGSDMNGIEPLPNFYKYP